MIFRRFCPAVLALMVLVLPTVVNGSFQEAGEAFGFNAEGKVAFSDMDGDGWVDLYAGGRLYRNDNGRRVVVVNDAGVKGAPGVGGVWGDYDNDGLPDLFVYSGRLRLHRNQRLGSQFICVSHIRTVGLVV